MPERLSWSFAARVQDGPSIATAGELDVEAYAKVAVTLADGAEQSVEIFPGDAVAQIVVITAEVPSERLTYKVGQKTFGLDGPVVLIGAGAAALLGDKLGALKFTNATGADASISIIAGRDATP